MIENEETLFCSQNTEENAITSENITPNSQKETINDERSYLSAEDLVTTDEKCFRLRKFIKKGNNITTSIRRWIDFTIASSYLTPQELAQDLAKDDSIANINDFLEIQEQKSINAQNNRALQEDHGYCVLYFQRPFYPDLEGQKLILPKNVPKKVSFKF